MRYCRDREAGYNPSHEWSRACSGYCETREQRGAHALTVHASLVYEIGSKIASIFVSLNLKLLSSRWLNLVVGHVTRFSLSGAGFHKSPPGGC
jgi:hypothetical protein